MTLKKGILPCLLLLCQSIFAQQDSITALHEVVVTDAQLRQFSNSQSVLALNDSVIRNNRPSLTELLRYNSAIYFKENGLGMVSSAAFRGTTAQQTAVVWNGLNINSMFNGQTDFNTVPTQNFNSVSVRAGGGSVIYGSSAIGGSVHLNNELEFGRRFENRLDISGGSFDTHGMNYDLLAATDVFSVQVGVSRNVSDNDYEFPDSGRRNTNGQFDNTSFDAGFAYKINPRNVLKAYSYFFDGERHFSLISPTETKTRYGDFNTRNLLEWTGSYGRLTSTAKLAFMSETYKYFGTLDAVSNYGKAETAIAKYDADYAFTEKLHLNAVAELQQTRATGSDIGAEKRQIGSFSMLLGHRVSGKFGYEIGARKEATGSYDSPFLFSGGADYRVARHYTVKMNGSKNFRIPTFNDLYWSDGGNPDLKAESSVQGEIGNEFRYKNLVLSVTGYYIDIKDMILWLPGTTASWHPVNINKVKTYGAEGILGWHAKIGTQRLSATATYAYTVSKNKETGYQLIYVPYHKATAALGYSLKRLAFDVQWLFNGKVFTRSDNNPRYTIEPYSVTNAGAGYTFGKTRTAKLGARILNLFDENYQVVAGRPFPGRNFNLYLNLNF